MIYNESEEIIIVKNLTKYYKNFSKSCSFSSNNSQNNETYFKALNNITFSLKRGEVLGITGPNASGKTTLLKVLSGIINYDSGIVNIYGKVVPFLTISGIIDKNLNGLDNIITIGNIFGIKNIKEKINTIACFSELTDFLKMPLKFYSSGMIERLFLSTILHVNSDILIFDEIFNFSDVHFKNKILPEFTNVFKNKTAIIVSHDTELLLNFCTKLLILINGNLISFDIPYNAISTYYQYIIQNFFKNTISPNNFPLFLNEIELYNAEIEPINNSTNSKILKIKLNVLLKKDIKFGFVLYNLFNQRLSLILSPENFKPKQNLKINIITEIDISYLNDGAYKIDLVIIDQEKNKFKKIYSFYFYIDFEKKQPLIQTFSLKLNSNWLIH